jgi:hypothetical protein
VLAQVVLLRQPCSPIEQVVGGFLNQYEADYVQRPEYVETERIFSLNPCLYPARTARYPWPSHGDEGMFTRTLVNEGYKFAVYGQRTDPPRSHHLGIKRSDGWTV